MSNCIKILHLESSPIISNLVALELNKENILFEKIDVSNKTDFKKALKTFSPDIIIANHTLSYYTAVDAINTLQENKLKVPIIIVTLSVSNTDIIKIMKAGADDFIFFNELHRLPKAVLKVLNKLHKVKNEEELYYSYKHLKPIINASNEGIIGIKLNGEITSWNKVAEELFGYSEAEAIGKNISLIISPEYLIEETCCTEFIQKHKTVRLTKNGTRIDVSITICPIKDANGVVIGATKIIYDISEKKQNKQFINDDKDKYHSLFKNSIEGILLTVTNGDILEVNPAACAIFDMTEEEICQANIFELIDSTDPRVTTAFKERERTGKIRAEISLIRRNNIKFEGEITSVTYKNTNGEHRTSIIVRDISERKKNEKKLINRESFNKEILSSLDAQIAVINNKGKILSVNKAWNDFIKENEDSWLSMAKKGSNYFTLSKESISKGDHYTAKAMDGIQSVFNSKISTFAMEFPHSSLQKQQWFNLRVIHFGNDTNKIMVSRQNITEKRRLEDLLEKSNRLAALGSWEIDVLKGTVYWSDITKEIREVDQDFKPTLDVGINYFNKGIDKETISKKVEDCIQNGTPWDEELQIITFKGNLKWVRTIGEGEFINGKCVKIHGSFQDIDKLKNAELKIKESEFRYRQIVETAQEGIWMLDENNETTFVNQKMCEIIGYSAKEMIGKTNFFFKDKDGLQNALYNLKRRKQGISETYNTSFITKTGRLIWTQISSNPMFNDTNAYKGSLWMVSDITKKLKADKRLLESEQKYRKLATQLDIERTRLVTAQAVAKVGSWEMDLLTMKINWSKEMHRIFGSSANTMQVTQATFVNLIHPEDKEELNNTFQESLHKKGSHSIEHRIITWKGEEKWVEQNWSTTKDKNGAPVNAVGTCQDITESKLAAEKVIRSEAKLKLAQHIAQVGSYEVDANTREQTWSDELYNILGITKDTPSSRETFVQFIHPEDRARALSTIDVALASNKDGSCLFKSIKANGEIGYASSEWKFEFDAQENPIYIHGILRDLTTEKKAERERLKMISEIIKRNSDLEQFSYIVSHNLRAPTANIIGYTTILQDEILTTQEQKQLLKGLSASVAGLDVIIKDINTILQNNRDLHEKKEIIVFSNLVEDIKVSIQHLIDKHQVVLTTDFSEIKDIYSIKVYIYSIFYNIISNSIKYSKPNEQPIIEIKSKVENEKIILTFRDYGLGIDLKTKGDKLFGLYNRFHFHVEGKGMGLFMVKTQVESLGGKIEVASEPNEGTLFTIEI